MASERVVSDHDPNTLRMRVEAEGDLAKFETGNDRLIGVAKRE